MNFEQLLSQPPKQFLGWLTKEFLSEPMLQRVESAVDMEEASRVLIRLSGYYSYLCELLSYAKLDVREKKRSGNRDSHEDAIDRRDTVQCITDAVKQQYAAVSRAVTIYIENSAEMRMTGNVNRQPRQIAKNG